MAVAFCIASLEVD